MSTGPAESSPERFARRHLLRNAVALGVDFGLFLVGMSFASQSTILPAFAAHLGAPNVVIGAIPAVMTLGWLLPQLFAAGHTEGLTRKMPFVMRWTVWERAPFLVMAAAAFFVADAAPALALGLLLAMLLVITGVGGLLMPAWMDVVARTIPANLRGRFFAVASVLGNVGGLAGSLATAYILSAVAAPASFGLCFLAGALAMGFSYAALAFTREPPGAARAGSVTLRKHLARMPGLLHRDRNLCWFLLARGCNIVGAMAGGFFTVYALRAYAAPPWQAGVFTSVMLAGQVGGNVILGWTADRMGHRVVLLAGGAAMLVANATALLAPTLSVFSAVFALMGLQQAAYNVSNLNILLDFAPAPGEHPSYVGLGNTAMAPVAFLSPLVAGLVADAAGFEVVFASAAVFGAGGLGLLAARVRDPRHAPRRDPTMES